MKNIFYTIILSISRKYEECLKILIFLKVLFLKFQPKKCVILRNNIALNVLKSLDHTKFVN